MMFSFPPLLCYQFNRSIPLQSQNYMHTSFHETTCTMHSSCVTVYTTTAHYTLRHTPNRYDLHTTFPYAPNYYFGLSKIFINHLTDTYLLLLMTLVFNSQKKVNSSTSTQYTLDLPFKTSLSSNENVTKNNSQKRLSLSMCTQLLCTGNSVN